MADRVGFEPTSRLRDYLISSFMGKYRFEGFCRLLLAVLYSLEKP